MMAQGSRIHRQAERDTDFILQAHELARFGVLPAARGRGGYRVRLAQRRLRKALAGAIERYENGYQQIARGLFASAVIFGGEPRVGLHFASPSKDEIKRMSRRLCGHRLSGVAK